MHQVVAMSHARCCTNNGGDSAAASGTVCSATDVYKVPASIDQAQMGGVR